MVVVLAIQIFHVQRQTYILRKGSKPFAKKLRVHVADLGPRKLDLPDEMGAARNVE